MQTEVELDKLLLARQPCIAMCTFEEEDALTLVRDAAAEAQRDLWLWSNSRGLRDGLIMEGASVAGSEHPVTALNFLLSQPATPTLTVMLDLAPHLKEAIPVRLLRDLIEKYRRDGSSLVLIDYSEELPQCIRAVAAPLELAPPDEIELQELMRVVIREQNDRHPVRVDLSPTDQATMLRNLRGLSRRQVRRVLVSAMVEDGQLSAGDVNGVLAAKRRQYQDAGVLEYVEAPVSMDEIGGLAALKRWLGQRQVALNREAVEYGVTPPRGLLMLGVQGGGKSLSAKAVATAWGRPLMRLDPGCLFDRYIGESERRLRDALRQAEAMAPIILWVDEIEKGFASSASTSTDGGLSRRMLGTLLTWLQEHKAPVFTVATANDIEALPPELLRKGRFDEIFFVDLPNLETRAQIFAIHLKKRKRSPLRFDIPALAAASEGFSGAEIEQAVVSALHEAFSANVELTTQHLIKAVEKSPPLSVTMAERMQALREWATGRCVPAE
jgi:ATP-dependent 26S proteasome regulatory subunit